MTSGLVIAIELKSFVLSWFVGGPLDCVLGPPFIVIISNATGTPTVILFFTAGRAVSGHFRPCWESLQPAELPLCLTRDGRAVQLQTRLLPLAHVLCFATSPAQKW